MKPQYLYKYGSFSVIDGKERFEQILNQNALYFAAPKDFNDPFDCDYIPHITKKHVLELIRKRKLMDKTLMKRKKLNSRIKKEYESFLSEKNKGAVLENSFRDNIKSTYGILCLSECKNNIQIFSYYADCHKGYCLEFEVKNEIEKNFFYEAQKIVYVPKYPDIRFDNAGKDVVDSVLITKHIDWSHEKEWRLIKTPDQIQNNRLLRFHPHLLTGIILGYGMPEADKVFVKNLIAKANCKINLYQAIKVKNEYRIETNNLNEMNLYTGFF